MYSAHGRSYVGAGGLRSPNFTGFINEGQFEHNGIITKVNFSGNYKRKVEETSMILINSLSLEMAKNVGKTLG